MGDSQRLRRRVFNGSGWWNYLARYQGREKLSAGRTATGLFGRNQGASACARRKLWRVGRHVLLVRLRCQGRPSKGRPMERHYRRLHDRWRLGDPFWPQDGYWVRHHVRYLARCFRGCWCANAAHDGGRQQASCTYHPRHGLVHTCALISDTINRPSANTSFLRADIPLHRTTHSPSHCTPTPTLLSKYSHRAVFHPSCTCFP